MSIIDELKGTTKQFGNDDPWMLAEDIPNIDFQFSQIWLSSFVNDLERTIGRNYAKILCIYRGLNLVFYYGERDANDVAETILDKLKADPSFGDTINRNIREHSDRLKSIARQLKSDALRSMTGDQLADLYHELDRVHTELYTWGWLPNAVDMFHGNFTNYLSAQLQERLSEDRVNHALVTLSLFPEPSVLDQEHTSFLRIASRAQAGTLDEELTTMLQEHADRYGYLDHLWINTAAVRGIDHYRQLLADYQTSGRSAAQELEEKRAATAAGLSERSRLLDELKLGDSLERLFHVYGEFSVTKLYRRDAQLFWAWKMDALFAELSRRLHISFDEARFLFPEEVVEGLRSGSLSAAVQVELSERVHSCVYYAEKAIDRLFVGEDARALAATTQSHHDESITELKGQVACLGQVTGTVRIVNGPADMAGFEPGNILVSIATNPDVVPAMKLAGAIVTEQGGITSHAAIVSRELNVPCVIGTKIATKVFKNGDLVEVDANHGIVRKVEV